MVHVVSTQKAVKPVIIVIYYRTHLVVVLRTRNASTAEDVVSAVSERTAGLDIVLQVGTLSDIPGKLQEH